VTGSPVPVEVQSITTADALREPLDMLLYANGVTVRSGGLPVRDVGGRERGTERRHP
jgi:hypothetical protein